MNDTQTSKFLSYVLRHEPEAIGLTLDDGGWARVDELVARAREEGRAIERETIERVVEASGKDRFALSGDGEWIRANDGHSIEVDLGLEPTAPPPTLCHGTARRFLDAIRREGLIPKGRQWVHLNADTEAGRQRAREVGARHGDPVLLRIDTKRVDNAFFASESGTWLTEAVPPEAIACAENPR